MVRLDGPEGMDRAGQSRRQRRLARPPPLISSTVSFFTRARSSAAMAARVFCGQSAGAPGLPKRGHRDRAHAPPPASRPPALGSALQQRGDRALRPGHQQQRPRRVARPESGAVAEKRLAVRPLSGCTRLMASAPAVSQAAMKSRRACPIGFGQIGFALPCRLI